MFGSGYLKHLSPDEVDPFLKNVQKEAEPLLRQNGQWSADYRRLRIVAYKRY
jgi:trans-aconitate 2-methyltransferase